MKKALILLCLFIAAIIYIIYTNRYIYVFKIDAKINKITTDTFYDSGVFVYSKNVIKTDTIMYNIVQTLFKLDDNKAKKCIANMRNYYYNLNIVCEKIYLHKTIKARSPPILYSIKY